MNIGGLIKMSTVGLINFNEIRLKLRRNLSKCNYFLYLALYFDQAHFIQLNDISNHIMAKGIVEAF